jgi:hypothetical protein
MNEFLGNHKSFVLKWNKKMLLSNKDKSSKSVKIIIWDAYRNCLSLTKNEMKIIFKYYIFSIHCIPFLKMVNFLPIANISLYFL